MWILPNRLLSQYAQATGGWNSASKEQLAESASHSLHQRSKHGPSKTWLRKWKQGFCPRLQSGAICEPFRQDHFTAWWTSCAAAILVRIFRQQVSAPDSTGRRVRSGGMCVLSFETCNRDSAFSKMSPGTSRLDSPQSSATWKKMVTAQSGEYSQRLKSARLTSANGCSSLRQEPGSYPTPAARDYKNTSENPEHNEARWEHSRGKTLPEFVKHGPHALESRSTGGSLQEQWPTATSNMMTGAGTAGREGGMNLQTKVSGKLNPRWVETLMGLPVGWTMPSCSAPVTIESMNCACLETASCLPPLRRLGEFSTGDSWGTRRVTTNGGNGNPERFDDKKSRLEDQVYWPTIRASDADPGITVGRLEGELGGRLYDKETGRNCQYGLTQQVQLAGGLA